MARISKTQIDPDNVPVHVGIIMDGNGRWAAKRFLPRIAGHQAGVDALKKISKYASKLGIKYVTVYAFSTENWKRTEEEVSGIMRLLIHYLRNAETELAGDDARIRVIGERSRLSPEIRAEIDRVEKVTAGNKTINVTLAINYGSREEITRCMRIAAQKAAAGELKPNEIDDKFIASQMYTDFMPDPDLIIRTSGEERISNFLLWQSAYSELYFDDTLWPDFDERCLERAVLEYQKRNRRFGGRI